MQIKKYEAIDMHEALRMVKNDLGSDAVILSSRKVKRGGGAFGMLGRPMVEVTAAIDYPIPSLSERGKAPGESGKGAAVPVEMFVREDIQRLKDEIQNLLKNYSERTPSGIAQIKDEIAGLRESLKDLRNREHPEYPSDDFAPPVQIPSEWEGVYKRYVDSGIDEELALRMVKLLDRRESDGNPVLPAKTGDEDKRLPDRRACEMILHQTRVTGPLYRDGEGRKAAVIMGPTGAGKTTTLAKLAAGYALQGNKKKVVLVTLDTYRIAAVEQLKIYAKIIGVPAEVALSPKDLYAVFRRYRDADLFLVDTAGRNQKDQTYLSELAGYYAERGSADEAGNPVLEGHLVLPATLRSDVLLDIVRRFQVLPVRSLTFTKLDEVERYGQIFNVMIRAQKPISFFTMGQRVPEDIESATPEELVRLVMESSHVSEWEGSLGNRASIRKGENDGSSGNAKKNGPATPE